MQRKITLISTWLGYVSIAALLVMMVMITVSVVLRKTVDRPIRGDVELSELLMVAIVMMGLAYTQIKGGHVSVGMLVERFSPRAQGVIDIFGAVVTIGIISLVVWQSFSRALSSLTEGEVTMVLTFPTFWFRFLIPLGFFAWALQALVMVKQSISKLKKG